MAAQNDFFVKFDSNATAWARQLESQLKPARDAVSSLQRALAGLEVKSSQTSQKVRGELGRIAASERGGRGVGGGGGVSNDALKAAQYEQADAIKEVSAQLATTVAGLRAANAEIRNVPTTISNTLKRLAVSLNRHAEQQTGRGRSYDPAQPNRYVRGQGPIQHGTDLAAVNAIVRAAAQGRLGSSAVAGVSGRASVPPQVGIASIRRSDIDKANFDRVVLAIRAQTRVLSQGIKISNAPTNEVTTARTPAKVRAPARVTEAQAEAELETRVDRVKSDIAEIQGDIAQIIGLLGDELDDAGKEMVTKLRNTEQQLKAQLAKIEREETGATRGEQREQRRQAAEEARRARETITDVERERRAAQARLIASPGASDFDTRLGRARTAAGGNYAMGDLRKMAAAFREVGIQVRENTKTTKAELAERLKAAHQEYTQLYPSGAPQLATRDVNVVRATKIAAETESILGDLNALVAEREVAREVLRANLRGGGDKIQPARGRTTYGAGILGEEIGTPIARAGTPADVQRAYETFGQRAAEQFNRVTQLAAKRGFDPYDPRHQVQVGGEGAERQRGLAAVARLRDVREATRQLDQFAQRYYDLQRALVESRAFIGRATQRIQDGVAKETDQANIASARERIAENRALLTDMRREFGNLFSSPDFQAGFEQREGPQYGFDRQGRPIGSRAILDARREAFAERGFTESDYRALLNSTGTAVAGVRTALGSRELTRNIPDLGFNQRTNTFYSTTQRLSREEQEKLNQATRQLAAAQTKYFQTVRSGTASQEEVEQAAHKLENSANKLANQIERNFFGIAPPINALMGDASAGGFGPGLSDQTRRDEERRQRARDRAEYERTRKFVDTPEQAAVRARDSLHNAERRLAKAIADRAKVQEDLAEAERGVGRNMDPTRREHLLGRYTHFNEAAFSKQRELNRLESLRDMVEDPNTFRSGLAGLKLEGEGHQFGPEATFDTVIRQLTRQLEALTRAQNELVRRRAAGAPVADDHTAAIGRTQSTLNTAIALRDSYGIGGHVPLNQAVGQLRREVEDLLDQRRAATRGGGDIAELERQHQYLAAADRAVGDLERELEEARAAAVAAEAALNKETVAKKANTAATVAETNGRLVDLRAQRDAIKAEGPWRRADRKAAFAAGGAESADYQAINERRARLLEINRKINALDAAGGGRGGRGGGPRTAQAGDDGGRGGRNDLLRQILAELRATHATLKAGVPVSGVTADRADQLERTAGGRRRQTRAGYATTAELVAASSSSAEERAAAMEAQRRRLDRLRPSEYDPRTGTGRAVDAAYEEKARRERDLAGAVNRTEAEMRDVARAEQQVAQTRRLLTRETAAEIERLRELTRAAQNASRAQKEAANARVAAQQVTVGGLVNRDLRNANLYAQDRRAGVRTVLNDAGPQLESGELDSILRTQAQDPRFRRVGEGWGEDLGDGTLDGFGRVFGGGRGFFQRVLNTTGTFIIRNFAAGMVFGLTNALQQVIDQAIQTEATFVRVSAALDATGKDMGNIRADLAAISTDYGVALNDVYTTAAGLTGLFANAGDIAAATRIAAQMQIISGGAVNATEAMGILASTMSAFAALPGDDPMEKVLPGGVEGLQHVMDALTSIQNQLGVNVETTAEGVSAVAGLARQMNLSFEEAAVFTAQIAKQTNQTGAAAGEQFSRILGAAQTGRGRTALTEALGPQANAALAASDYGQLFRVLIENWDNLTDAQQRNLTTSLADQRQQRAFNALMNNGAKTLATLERAQEASGDAAERMDKIMETLNSRLARLGTQAQNLASNLVRSGILNFLGVLLVAADATLGVLNKLLVLLNGAADENAFLGMLRKMITLLLGAGIAFKLLGAGVNGVRSAMRQLPGRSVAEEGITRTPRGAAFGAFGQDQTGVRRQAYISRSVGFGLDRTVGVAASGTARGLGALGKRLGESERDFGRFNNRMRALAGWMQRAGANEASGLRGGFQSFGTGRFGPSGYFERRAERLTAQASSLRTQAGAARLRASQQQALGQPGFARFGAYATELDKSAAAADRAAARNARLSNSLARVNQTGAVTDAAMIGLAVAIAAVGGSLARHRRIAADLQEGYDAAYGKNAGKNQAEQVEDYLGKVAEDAAKEFEENSKKNRFSAGLDAIGSRFTNGWRGFFDEQYAMQREFGLDLEGGRNETYGLTSAQNQLDLASDELSLLADQPGITGEAIRERMAEINNDIDGKVKDIKSDSDLSDAQKQQAIGALQAVQHILADQAEDLAAVADGMGATIALSSDQVKKLGEAMQVAASTQGLTSFGGGGGGVDLAGVYQSLIADVGAGEGTRIESLLERMFSGTSDAADIAVSTSRLMQDQVKQLQNSLDAKIAENADTEEIEAIRGQMIGVVSGLLAQQNATIDAIINSGSLLANLFANEGRDIQSVTVFARAMNRAERFYQNQTREQRTNIRNARRTQRAAIRAARAIEDNPLLGGIITPREAANREGAPSLRGRDAQHRQQMADQVSTAVEREIQRQTRPLRLKQSKTKDAQARAFYDQKIAEITLGILQQVNQGLAPGALAGRMGGLIEDYGNAAVTQDQITQEQINANQAAIAYAEAAEQTANSAAQNAFDLRSAQLGVASAYADARGDAVASARIQVQVARAAMALAQAQLAEANTTDEINAARVAILGAQAQLIAANAAVTQAQQDLVQSRFEVSIALAEAAGNSVLAAERTLQAARQALRAAMRRSGGRMTAEVNAARVQAIQAEAALRDARLQDDLDTIDFNLQMGKITQASAIAALKEILRTRDLTRDQRRQLLLQIKGMQDEMADSQWNFGNIKLPTPYQMRAYIAARRDQFRNDLEAAALGGARTSQAAALGAGPRAAGSVTNQTTIYIDGSDIAEVKRVIREVVGGSASTITRTTGARRR